MNEKKIFNSKETADYLGISDSVLRQSRMEGKTKKTRLVSPPFIRAGRRVCYLKSDLDKWMLENKQGHLDSLNQINPLAKILRDKMAELTNALEALAVLVESGNVTL